MSGSKGRTVVEAETTRDARVIDAFRLAASQTRQAAASVRGYMNGVLHAMDGGSLYGEEGMPSAAEAYVQAEANLRQAWSLLPSYVPREAVREMLRGDYVAIRTDEPVKGDA